MAYIDEITAPVVRVLSHASQLPPHRFAGYAANADFWVGEVRHCLDVIDGYDKRFRKLKDAVAGGWESPPPTTQTTTYQDRAAAKRALREVARQFLVRCQKTPEVPNADLVEHCRRLDVRMPL